MSEADTIFALATAPGRAGVAVMRISGPGARRALLALAGPEPEPRRASLRRFTWNHEVLDDGLALLFPAPSSFTGEDVVELHLHGGTAVVEAMAGALLELGLRPARPGEFSRRAFENGRMDLTQAEAIADLVEAETAGQRAQALRQLHGELGRLYESWRADLVAALALIEAEIDFPDEGDVPGGLAARAGPKLAALVEALNAHLADAHRGERVRDGFHVALIGAPNAGKSTLFNRLVGREAAIVTEIPGTTRDVVEARAVLAGFPVTLSDTAGLRDTRERVEAEGVRRARARAAEADLRIAVVDAGAPGELAAVAPALRAGDILWINKTDLAAAAEPGEGLSHVKRLEGAAASGAGVEALQEALEEAVRTALAPAEQPSLTRARHRAAAERAVAALERARARLADAPELAGEDARLAARALGEITGRVDVEEILDRIFADFCIGK